MFLINWTTEATHQCPYHCIGSTPLISHAKQLLFFPINHQRSRKRWGVWRKCFSFFHLLAEKENGVSTFLFWAEEDIVLMAEMSALWIFCTCCLETAVELAPCFRCCLTCQELNFTQSVISLQFPLTHWLWQVNLWQFRFFFRDKSSKLCVPSSDPDS